MSDENLRHRSLQKTSGMLWPSRAAGPSNNTGWAIKKQANFKMRSFKKFISVLPKNVSVCSLSTQAATVKNLSQSEK